MRHVRPRAFSSLSDTRPGAPNGTKAQSARRSAWDHVEVSQIVTEGAAEFRMVSRMVAAIATLAGVAFVVLMVVTAVGGPDPGVPIVFAGLAVVGLVALWRVSARVGPDGVTVSGVVRTKRLPWSEVDGFRYLAGQGQGVYVLYGGDQMIQLPADGADTDLCTELEAIRSRYWSAGP